MSQKPTLHAFFNQNPPPKASRTEVLQLRKDFGRLVGIANKVFGGPACTLEAFDSLSVKNGVTLPALRLSYPNGAKLEFFDSLSLYSVSITSPGRDVPARFLNAADHPGIDWSVLHKPGMPEQMAYPPHRQNPQQFTFKTYDREPAQLQKLVLQFSWLQKQAMGLTKPPRAEPVEEIVYLPPAETRAETQPPTPAQESAALRPLAV